ncbi:laccase, multicopper oxidase, benzenediol:oxygen oxidorectuctase [Agyrium rufum]|nr:laccase, multicopper oxidase, benzenediol:oxygen oxidorectuctase [Agyrium rufum]
MKNHIFTSLACYVTLALAAILPRDISSTIPSSTIQARKTTSCANTPTSRGCWGKYSINTNFYEETPHTGVTREYWLTAQNSTLAPDGVPRMTLNFNGTIPGPLITADWGDNLIIHVTNHMANNGTAIHWHGFRQLRNNEYDGVPGVTQCPIAPGQTMTYKFRATQYGSTWYHSHYSLQYGDGLYGTIIINGPATANYDEDVGFITLSDWGHESVFEQWYTVEDTALPVTLENGLINGMNKYGKHGRRYQTVFKPGRKYRIRIVNTAMEGHFRFAIDGHNFTVIANDLVPIVPYETDNVIISMGQRYDLIVEAKINPTKENYWMRAIWQSTCNANKNPNGILGIVRYNAASTADPTTESPSYPDACGDEPYTALVPHVPLNVSPHGVVSTLELGGTFNKILQWTINNSSLYLNWSEPTNLRIANGLAVFPTDYNVYPLVIPNQWVIWVINDVSHGFPYHPMHLHGHDAFILAQGNGTYSPSTVKLKFDNPPRRDTATLAAGGYLVLAFKTDNPGSWLMHCHVAWHASEGLAVQFVEREKEISSLMQTRDLRLFEQTCKTWDGYWNGREVYNQTDSGI